MMLLERFTTLTQDTACKVRRRCSRRGGRNSVLEKYADYECELPFRVVLNLKPGK
jgi:hypothetical protein